MQVELRAGEIPNKLGLPWLPDACIVARQACLLHCRCFMRRMRQFIALGNCGRFVVSCQLCGAAVSS